MTTGANRGSDLQSSSQWGRYNLNYREVEPSDAGRSLPCGANQLTVPRPISIQRHSSDLSDGRGSHSANLRTATVSRTESDRTVTACRGQTTLSPSPPTRAAVLRSSSLVTESTGSRPASCLRLSIIRSESDSRKKKVAFSDAPAVVWGQIVGIRSGAASDAGVAVQETPDVGCQVSLVTSSSRSSPNGRCSNSSGLNGDEAEKQVLTPKERRRRKVAMAVVCTTFILLTASALFVLITLFNASAIDEAGKRPLSPLTRCP